MALFAISALSAMLFMAAEVEGQGVINYEQEEAGILQATNGLPLNLSVEESGAIEKDPLALLRLSGYHNIERNLTDCSAEDLAEPAVALVEKRCDVPPDLDQQRQLPRLHRRIVSLGPAAQARECLGCQPPHRLEAALAGIGAEQFLAPQLDPRIQHPPLPGLLIMVKMRRATADRNNRAATAELPKSYHKRGFSQAESAQLTKRLWNNCGRFHAHPT